MENCYFRSYATCLFKANCIHGYSTVLQKDSHLKSKKFRGGWTVYYRSESPQYLNGCMDDRICL